MSVKYQITLPEELAMRLKQAAATLEIPLAQFIRETMEEKLRQQDTRPGVEDPFHLIRGIVESEEHDLSSRVDEVLYAEGSGS